MTEEVVTLRPCSNCGDACEFRYPTPDGAMLCWPCWEKRYESLRNGAAGDDVESTLGAIPTYPTEALPAPARTLVAEAARTGLPAALTGGAVLAAMAAAIGANAQLAVTDSWPARAILWVALLAPAGAGKSPSQDLAFGPLRARDADAGDEDGRVLHGDTTLEALARELAASDGAGAADLDELTVLLRGLGEYKRQGGGDRGRFLQLWTGAPWTIKRVGGGGQANAVRLRVNKPTLVICGGLQPRLHELLGGEEDGMRPRWLPHLAAMPERASLQSVESAEWATLLDVLASRRAQPRRWHLGPPALRAFEHFRKVWKNEARGAESATVTAALVKSDVHLARAALVLAEAERPCAGGAVTAETVERAACIVRFTLDCWRALPAHGSLALTRRDEVLDRGIAKLIDWLERREGGKGSRREIRRACVAGARTADQVEALLSRYEDMYPGCVVEESGSHGGLPTTIVRAPRRTSYLSVGSADSGIYADRKAHNDGRFGGVGAVGIVFADTAPREPILVPRPVSTDDPEAAPQEPTTATESVRLRPPEPAQADRPRPKYLRAAAVIAAELADGEKHPSVPIRERLAALGLNNDALVDRAKRHLAGQGRPVEKSRQPTEHGGRSMWRIRSAQLPLESVSPDQDEPANSLLVEEALRHYRGRS